MSESEIQPKRVPLLSKPKRHLELLRVMADEWEYEDSAGARYLELRTDQVEEWFLLVVPKVDHPIKPTNHPGQNVRSRSAANASASLGETSWTSAETAYA